MLTDSYLAQVTAHGLFAFAFMDNHNLAASPTTFNFVKNAVTRYAAPWIVPPPHSTSPTPTPGANSSRTIPKRARTSSP